MTLQSLVLLVLALSTFVTADDDGGSPPERIILAHGILMALMFVIFFPLGSIILRVLKVPHIAWIHGIWQTITYIGALAGFGIGAYLATTEDVWTTKQGHPIVGTIVIGGLLFQPFAGALHHQLYKKNGKPTIAGYTHRWSGRVLLLLGVINGGLGIWLSGPTRDFIIPYCVIAPVMYVAWALSIWWASHVGERSQNVLPKEHSTEARY